MYRRWPSKHALVQAALRHALPPVPRPRADRSARQNLMAILAGNCDILTGKTAFPMAEPLEIRRLTSDDLAAARRRRIPPTVVTQTLQRVLHRRLLAPVLHGGEAKPPAAMLKLFERVPQLSVVPAYLIGVGLHPRRVCGVAGRPGRHPRAVGLSLTMVPPLRGRDDGIPAAAAQPNHPFSQHNWRLIGSVMARAVGTTKRSTTMSWRRHLFEGLFRLGRPIWDAPIQPELRAAIEGEDALPAGRALDLGCGTSTNVVYLAQHGWDATGVDFSATAIQLARQNAKGVPGATFVEGDVTKLRQLGVSGPFDLVLDYGCFHSLGADDKRAYVPEVAAVMKSGAPLMMWEGIRMNDTEIPDLFGTDFVVERVEAKPFVIQRMKRHVTINGKWYRLRRR